MDLSVAGDDSVRAQERGGIETLAGDVPLLEETNNGPNAKAATILGKGIDAGPVRGSASGRISSSSRSNSRSAQTPETPRGERRRACRDSGVDREW